MLAQPTMDTAHATRSLPTVAVLGGGALGLAAALRLAEAGSSVTVYEREPRLGGLAAGFGVGPSALEKFYHHIFKTDTTILRFIRELGLEPRLIWGSPNTSVLYQRRIARLSTAVDVLRFPFLGPVDRVRLGGSLAWLKAVPSERAFVGQTAASWIRRVMGRRVYEVQWEPLLRGKFGDRADDIAMSWFWSRVRDRTISLGYLRGGFQQLYDAMGTRIEALGGRIRTGTAVTGLEAGPNGVTVASGATAEHFDRVLVTLPARLFIRLARGLPESYVQRYPGPDHEGAHVVILGLDRSLTNGIYWLNINDRDFPFLALVEHTSFLPASDYGGLHLVYLGNYLPMDHPLFAQSDAEVLASFLPALRQIRPDFDPAWITASWVFKAPYAQPIVTTDYLDRLPPHRTPLAGVYLANMAHVYPHDRGQNYSMRLGEELARMIQADAHQSAT
ncbi:MAG: NAD(P)/FAD-dependent oxidoreductase [Chloroflexi bacterium]|nr:NAD(P)/FAD-dependent oxidoreductase [Chloroflexota bacterium]